MTLTPHGSGRPRTAHPRLSDGGFTFPSLPSGSHLLTVDAPGLAYPPVWVWVRPVAEVGGGVGDGQDQPADDAPLVVEAALADEPARFLAVSPALALRPSARSSPFDERGRFDPVAFLKTPYGLLLAFVAFAVFALPRLRIDPDEYEELMAEAQEQRATRGQGGGGDGGGGGQRAAALQR